MQLLGRASLQRRHFSLALGASVLGLAGRPLWAQNRLEKRSITIAVNGKSSLYYLPLTIAEQLGYFQAEGLTVEVLDVPATTRAHAALAEGRAEVASAAFEHTLNAPTQSAAMQAFVLMGRAPQMALGVSSKTLTEYRSAGDLRGKKIAVGGPGASADMLLRLVLARAGLTATDINLVAIGNANAALNALRSGQIDAISSVDPVMTLLEQKGEVRIVADTRTLKGTQEVFGGPMPAACLYASLEFVQKNLNTVQALTHAIVHALKWLQTAGPGDLIKAVPEDYLLGDRALYLAAFNNVRESIAVDGLFSEDAAKTAWRALSNFEPTLKTARIDLRKTYTNQFALKAKARFNA